MKHFSPKNIALCLSGSFLYCLAVNVFIVPAGLYSSGFVGISQLIADAAEGLLHTPYSIQPAAYFLLNVPLFLAGFRILGLRSISVTFLIIAAETLFMSLIPVPDRRVIDDAFALTVCGGALEGLGSSLTFRGFGTSGGTDLLGLMLTQKYRKLSVGRVNLAVNILVYAFAAIRNSFQAAVYSLIAEIFASIVIDRYHKQNNLVTVHIVSSRTDDFVRYIMRSLDRGATILKAEGAYSGAERKVVISVLSEYELGLLEKEAEEIDPDAFIFSNPRTDVFGEFEKRLS